MQMLLTNRLLRFYDYNQKSNGSFAKQLGVDVRKQITYCSDYLVYHGPVIYLDEDKRNEFINRSLRMYHIRESFPHFLSITDQ